jgi:opacity protein-like surface antigen
MKTQVHFLVLAGLLTALLVSSRVEAQERGGYMRMDAGGNITMDTDLKEFFGPVAPGSKVSFDPGYRFGFAGGYNITDWFGAEGQLGVYGNNIRSITGATRVSDAWFWNDPLMANIRLQLPNRSIITPYIGGGAGGSFSTLSVDHISIGGVTLQGTQTTAVWAAQAFAGLRFKLGHGMGLGVEYRYFVTGEPEWNAAVPFGAPSDKLRFGGAQTHSICLVFESRF